MPRRVVRKDGVIRWQGRGPLPNREKRSFATKREAQAWEIEVRKAKDQGAYIAARAIPTFGKTADEWLLSKQTSYRPNSLASWAAHRAHLAVLDHHRLDRVSVAVIERVRDELHAAGRLSASSVNAIIRTAAAVFKFAIRRGYCVTNPCAVAERLRASSGELLVEGDEAPTSADRSVTKADILDPTEIRRLIAAAAPGYDQTLVMTIALTGMRIDEALALRWGDVEFDQRKLYVRRSLSWAPSDAGGQRACFHTPKTRAGTRAIPFAQELAPALRRWKLACPKGDADLVFPSSAGAPVHRMSALRCALCPALRRAGLRQVGFHSLRHSYASALIANGAAISEVQHLLGHGNAAITLRVYTHFFKNIETDSADRLGRAIFGSNGPRLDPSAAETAKSA